MNKFKDKNKYVKTMDLLIIDGVLHQRWFCERWGRGEWRPVPAKSDRGESGDRLLGPTKETAPSLLKTSVPENGDVRFRDGGKAMNERYLDLVIEECAEVIQCCAKIKRFGATDSHPSYYNGLSNDLALEVEIGDLLSTLEHLGVDIDCPMVQDSKAAKAEKLKVYGPDGTYLRDKEAGENSPVYHGKRSDGDQTQT